MCEILYLILFQKKDYFNIDECVKHGKKISLGYYDYFYLLFIREILKKYNKTTFTKNIFEYATDIYKHLKFPNRNPNIHINNKLEKCITEIKFSCKNNIYIITALYSLDLVDDDFICNYYNIIEQKRSNTTNNKLKNFITKLQFILMLKLKDIGNINKNNDNIIQQKFEKEFTNLKSNFNLTKKSLESDVKDFGGKTIAFIEGNNEYERDLNQYFWKNTDIPQNTNTDNPQNTNTDSDNSVNTQNKYPTTEEELKKILNDQFSEIKISAFIKNYLNALKKEKSKFEFEDYPMLKAVIKNIIKKDDIKKYFIEYIINDSVDYRKLIEYKIMDLLINKYNFEDTTNKIPLNFKKLIEEIKLKENMITEEILQTYLDAFTKTTTE